LLGSAVGLVIVLAVVLVVSVGSNGDSTAGGGGVVAGGPAAANTPTTVHVHPAAVLPKKVVQVALPNGTIDPNKIDLSGTPGVTAAEQARATSLLRRTILTITKWDDVNVAIKDGFHSIGDGITGDEHFLHWDWINDNDFLDPNKPEALVYHVNPDGTKTLEAAMYILPNKYNFTNLPDIGGPLTQFHIHNNLCFTNDPVAPRVAGLTNGEGGCNPPLVQFHPNPMVHVWIRNNPCGPFAALEGVGAGQTAPGTSRSCDAHNGNEATL
jgi:hypothetical protein